LQSSDSSADCFSVCSNGSFSAAQLLQWCTIQYFSLFRSLADTVRSLYEIRCHICGRNVDDVHNLMDDVAEQQEIANEISDAISNPVGFQQDVDEASDDFCF